MDTHDKYIKIIIYSNKSWDYYNTGKPVILNPLFYNDWNTNSIHSFRNYAIEDLPKEINITLADSLHHYCSPIIGNICSGYKFRRYRDHKGIDIPLKLNDKIKAAFDGVVRIAMPSYKTGGYGNLIVIRHDNGLETYYGHLNKYIVKPGELVKAGEIIGYGGNTGRSTGPHLHFEVRYNGQPFDPQRLINFDTGELRDSTLTLKNHYFSIYSHQGQSDEESKAAAGRVIHTIKSGDTLGGIAIKYGTTVSKICKLNKITTKTTLRIGRRLIVR